MILTDQLKVSITPEHFHALTITGGRELPGYDPYQELLSEITVVKAKILPPSTPIEWLRVDESCEVCPINPGSPRYDAVVTVALAETVMSPCDPLGTEMSRLNTLLLRVFDSTWERPITTGDILLGLPGGLNQPLGNNDFWIAEFESVRNYDLHYNHFSE